MKFVIPSKVKLACLTIPGFSQEYDLIKQNMLLNGQSEATLRNYSRKLALISIYYNKPLGQINETEVKAYLAKLIEQAGSESISGFKHSVYSLRYFYNMHGVDLDIKLPSIPHRKKLPMVLSKEECMRLFQSTKNIKHRLVLKFIYAGGLRASEVANLKWSDIDFDRMMIHIKQGKGGKDRYLPLAANLLEELSEMNKNGIYSPYVFTGHYYDKFTRSGVRFLMNQAVKRIGLTKTGVCIHTLRHSFATHLLEDGTDLLTIKELLGHSRIESTLVYLHVTHETASRKTSPLDRLWDTPSQDELNMHKSTLTDQLRKKEYEKEVISQQLTLWK